MKSRSKKTLQKYGMLLGFFGRTLDALSCEAEMTVVRPARTRVK
jgi:hypothetical protein